MRVPPPQLACALPAGRACLRAHVPVCARVRDERERAPSCAHLLQDAQEGCHCVLLYKFLTLLLPASERNVPAQSVRERTHTRTEPTNEYLSAPAAATRTGVDGSHTHRTRLLYAECFFKMAKTFSPSKTKFAIDWQATSLSCGSVLSSLKRR